MFTEVYGYRVSRKIIWTGLLSVIFITSLASLYTYIPSGKDFDPLSEQAFNRIFRASPLVALAGALSFFLGEYTNSVWLAKMKVWTNGKWEAFRCITSTLF